MKAPPAGLQTSQRQSLKNDLESTGMPLIEFSFLAKTWNPPVCVSSSCHSWRRPGIHFLSDPGWLLDSSSSPGMTRLYPGWLLDSWSSPGMTRLYPGWLLDSWSSPGMTHLYPGWLLDSWSSPGMTHLVTPGFLVFARNDTQFPTEGIRLHSIRLDSWSSPAMTHLVTPIHGNCWMQKIYS